MKCFLIFSFVSQYFVLLTMSPTVKPHCFLLCVQSANRVLFLFQFNFVGRILGPRGMTAKQLEQETGCKIMVRGKGSMRDKKKVSTYNLFVF